MKIQTSSKGFRINGQSSRYLKRFLEKMNRRLPDFKEDLIRFELFIKKIAERYQPKRKHRHTGSDISASKSALARYEASFILTLPKKRLVTHAKGASAQECIHRGGKNLIKETKKYKDLHFKSFSQYPNHQSIRRGYGL